MTTIKDLITARSSNLASSPIMLASTNSKIKRAINSMLQSLGLMRTQNIGNRKRSHTGVSKNRSGKRVSSRGIDKTKQHKD